MIISDAAPIRYACEGVWAIQASGMRVTLARRVHDAGKDPV
jgi:hypothetical protein